MRQGRLHAFEPLFGAASAQVSPHDAETITVTLFELCKGIGLMRTRNDDDTDRRSDLGMIDERLKRSLQHGTATEIFIQLAAQPAGGAVTRARARSGNDQCDLHVDKGINGHGVSVFCRHSALVSAERYLRMGFLC